MLRWTSVVFGLVACTSTGPADGDDPDPVDTGTAFDGTDACLLAGFVDPPDLGPDYDPFGPTIGRHCKGTDHQDIRDVERVVFLGDSVTVGTPPAPTEAYYRTLLADQLAEAFGLEPPSDEWKRPNLVEGEAAERTSGAFWSCARYGARADDLLRDNSMIEDCFPEEVRDQRTLVVMTMGGNDVAAFTADGIEGRSEPDLRQDVEDFLGLMEDGLAWLKDPARHPAGVDVVFANLFEFTDGTGDVASCPGAALAGLAEPWDDRDLLEELVVHANEQFLRMAVEHDADMVFFLESFCGHGYRRDDPEAPCYRGPDAPLWIDATCIHPNEAGHAALADLFLTTLTDGGLTP